MSLLVFFPGAWLLCLSCSALLISAACLFSWCLLALLVFCDILSSAGACLLSWCFSSLPVLVCSAGLQLCPQLCWCSSSLQTTGGRPQAALPPACCPQRFKYLLTTWRVPNIYIGWGRPASYSPPIGSLPLLPDRPIRCEERPVLGGGVITYRHNKLKLKPVCHRLASLFIFN